MYTLLMRIETVYKQLYHSRFEETKLNSVYPEIKCIQEFFQCSQNGTLLICIAICEGYSDASINVQKILKYVNLENKDCLWINKELHILSDKNLVSYYILNDRNFEKHVEIKKNVMIALELEDPSLLESKTITDVFSFLDAFVQLTRERSDRQITNYYYQKKTIELINNHTKISFVQWLKEQNFRVDDATFFLIVASKTVFGDELIDTDEILELIEDSLTDRYNYKRRIMNGKNPLFIQNFLMLEPSNTATLDFILLTEKSKDLLLDEDANLFKKQIRYSYTQLIESKKIENKKLFYPKNVNQHINKLNQLLQKERFNQIAAALKNAAMNPGFTILAYGAPGTGKTETALQLAKNSCRNILMVDISKIRNMWVGETEKNMRKVFNEYRNALKNFELAPILLFNEADALFGKRRNVARSIDQMENTMQNVLLQELENFEGIFIATTNLVENLDAAFERRFLYKIKFEKPDAPTRFEIWKDKFTHFNNAHALENLANYSNLSGGQIENIRKKTTIDKLLNEDFVLTENYLLQLAQAETLNNKERNQIGFIKNF